MMRYNCISTTRQAKTNELCYDDICASIIYTFHPLHNNLESSHPNLLLLRRHPCRQHPRQLLSTHIHHQRNHRGNPPNK